MSKALEEIRKKIDSLDDRIHDLLMERADLIVDVSAEKKKSNIPVVQPAREAVMIRRLLKRHRGPLPEAAIVAIWRELVGAVSLLQTGLKVSVSTGDGQSFCWDMARSYFGTVLPMIKLPTSVAAVSAVREDESSFAVVPWPQESDSMPWWPFLMNVESGRMRVVCALPYGITEEVNAIAHDRALVVSKTDFSPSGDDCSLIVVETGQSISRGRVFDIMKELGMEPLSITTRIVGTGSLHLVEVSDYIADNDKRLKKIEEKFTDQPARCLCIGGYPVPPVYKKAEKQDKAKSKSQDVARKVS